MLKGQNKHIDKEQGKIKHEAPRGVNYRATQNKNNIGTTSSLHYRGGGGRGGRGCLIRIRIVTDDTSKSQSFTRTCGQGIESLALTREVNLATGSSAPSATERREPVSEFQSLIVWGKKLLL